MLQPHTPHSSILKRKLSETVHSKSEARWTLGLRIHVRAYKMHLLDPSTRNSRAAGTKTIGASAGTTGIGASPGTEGIGASAGKNWSSSWSQIGASPGLKELEQVLEPKDLKPSPGTRGRERSRPLCSSARLSWARFQGCSKNSFAKPV